MFSSIFLAISLVFSLTTGQVTVEDSNYRLLSSKSISLENRQPDKWVNDVFKDNILLAMSYLKGDIQNSKDIDWDNVRKPFKYEMVLKSDEIFAFHDDLLPEYKGLVTKTTNSHFNYGDGYKSDGYLMGDGVCHLASIINWPAKEAGLDVLAPTYHDFARINEVPREFGVSIYSNPYTPGSNARQNLYIKNNFENDIIFVFEFDGNILKVSVFEDIIPDSN